MWQSNEEVQRAQRALQDVSGRYVNTGLTDPQGIFSVKADTSNGAELNFRPAHKKLVHKDGTKFANENHGQLFDSQTL